MEVVCVLVDAAVLDLDDNIFLRAKEMDDNRFVGGAVFECVDNGQREALIKQVYNLKESKR